MGFNNNGFEYTSVPLEEMMKEREERASHSRSLLGRGTVVCMTMNMIGEYKVLPFSRAVFDTFYTVVKTALQADDSELLHKHTGDTAFFISPLSPRDAKSICERIEDACEAGRLLDIDVFDANGEKLSRTEKRKCLICEKSAAECARSRAHGVEAIREKTLKILSAFFTDEVTQIAEKALIDEVDTTPKPGLVDRNNSGANPDMSYDTFVKSAETIAPFLGKMFAQAGCFTVIDAEMADVLRRTGREAERAMYDVTGGVNTHKGAIYSLGLLCAGAGFVLAGGGRFSDVPDAAAQLARELARDIEDEHTHGMEVCRKYGVSGARGEAIGGFETVKYAFNRIKYYVDDRLMDANNAYPLVINDIMAVMTDTNVLHRAGREGLDYMRKEAKEIAEMRENQRIDELKTLDEELIKRNISPGGCADALACALLLIGLERIFPKGE